MIDTLAGIEQQLKEFNQLMEMVGSDRTVISAKTMPAIQAQYEALLPAFDNIDRFLLNLVKKTEDWSYRMFHCRLEVLVRRVQKDMDEIGDSKIKSNLKIPSEDL